MKLNFLAFFTLFTWANYTLLFYDKMVFQRNVWSLVSTMMLQLLSSAFLTQITFCWHYWLLVFEAPQKAAPCCCFLLIHTSLLRCIVYIRRAPIVASLFKTYTFILPCNYGSHSCICVSLLAHNTDLHPLSVSGSHVLPNIIPHIGLNAPLISLRQQCIQQQNLYRLLEMQKKHDISNSWWPSFHTGLAVYFLWTQLPSASPSSLGNPRLSTPRLWNLKSGRPKNVLPLFSQPSSEYFAHLQFRSRCSICAKCPAFCCTARARLKGDDWGGSLWVKACCNPALVHTAQVALQ